jgi:hypothetical protein
LVSPQPPQRDVAAEKRHAGTRGADPRGQPSRDQPGSFCAELRAVSSLGVWGDTPSATLSAHLAHT